MVIDTSALLAIIRDEPEKLSFVEAIELAESRRLSAASLVEVSLVVVGRFGPEHLPELDLLLHRCAIEVAPVDREQAMLARGAFVIYGKGRHPAGLNYGDCFAYALARFHGEPLLWKGNDFGATDVVPALLRGQ
jgi:ribonuclease VapC